jgi:hypothetical protein
MLLLNNTLVKYNTFCALSSFFAIVIPKTGARGKELIRLAAGELCGG